MSNDIPILIPVKGHSVRCINKNKELLPFTINYLKMINQLNNAIIITDCEHLKKYATSFGVKTFFEVREKNQDELYSCYNFLINNSIEVDCFFMMPVTHPFRASNLFKLFLEKEIKPEIDFIVSSCIYTDRKIFFLKENKNGKIEFLHKNFVRKGEYCQQHYMIDGSLYLIKVSFLENVINSKNTNETFWKGNFQIVTNEAPFLDIDTPQDLEKFNYIVKFDNEVKNSI